MPYPMPLRSAFAELVVPLAFHGDRKFCENLFIGFEGKKKTQIKNEVVEIPASDQTYMRIHPEEQKREYIFFLHI